MFSPKIAVGTNGSVKHHKQVRAEKVRRERKVNDPSFCQKATNKQAVKTCKCSLPPPPLQSHKIIL